MATQIELLRESIARQEARHGPGSPYVKGLKDQLVSMERQGKSSSPQGETFFGGAASKDPMAQAASSYEAQARALASGQLKTGPSPSKGSTSPGSSGGS